MQEWDLASIGLVLMGSSLTVAGIIMAAMLHGFAIPLAPFLFFTTAVLIVMSAALAIFGNQVHEPGNGDFQLT